jgi:hypothetical protein
MSLASQINLLASRVAGYIKSAIVPRLVPFGGAQGTALVKTGSADFALGWQAFPDLSNIDTLTYNRNYRLDDGYDLNGQTRAGFYDGSSLNNAPDGGWYHFDTRVHSNGNPWMVQTAFPLNHRNGPFWRVKDGGNWDYWRRFWHDGNFAPDQKLNRNNTGGINFQNFNIERAELMREDGAWTALISSPDYSIFRGKVIGSQQYFEWDTSVGLTATYYNMSDANLKENIEPSQHDALSQITSIAFVDYNYRPLTGADETVRVEGGYIAQELELINPSWVTTLSDNTKVPAQPALAVSALRAIQQMHELITFQSLELADLRERVARLES